MRRFSPGAPAGSGFSTCASRAPRLDRRRGIVGLRNSRTHGRGRRAVESVLSRLEVERELDVDLDLEGAYWHPLEVLHLHVIARRRLRPEGILDRRIFPGVRLADIRHHLENVRV